MFCRPPQGDTGLLLPRHELDCAIAGRARVGVVFVITSPAVSDTYGCADGHGCQLDACIFTFGQLNLIIVFLPAGQLALDGFLGIQAW